MSRFMHVNKYRVTLIDAALLQGLGQPSWHTTISAHDMQSAWRKFNSLRLAPISPLGLSVGEGVAKHYDVRPVQSSRDVPMMLGMEASA